MSGPRAPPSGRRAPAASAQNRMTTPAPAATPTRIPWAVDRAITARAPSYAERSLGRLVDRVGAPRGPQDHARGVALPRLPLHLHGEAVHPLRRGAQPVLARLVVLRSVARALEPLALLAERDAAPEV